MWIPGAGMVGVPVPLPRSGARLQALSVCTRSGYKNSVPAARAAAIRQQDSDRCGQQFGLTPVPRPSSQCNAVRSIVEPSWLTLQWPGGPLYVRHHPRTWRGITSLLDSRLAVEKNPFHLLTLAEGSFITGFYDDELLYSTSYDVAQLAGYDVDYDYNNYNDYTNEELYGEDWRYGDDEFDFGRQIDSRLCDQFYCDNAANDSFVFRIERIWTPPATNPSVVAGVAALIVPAALIFLGGLVFKRPNKALEKKQEDGDGDEGEKEQKDGDDEGERKGVMQRAFQGVKAAVMQRANDAYGGDDEEGGIGALVSDGLSASIDIFKMDNETKTRNIKFSQYKALLNETNRITNDMAQDMENRFKALRSDGDVPADVVIQMESQRSAALERWVVDNAFKVPPISLNKLFLALHVLLTLAMPLVLTIWDRYSYPVGYEKHDYIGWSRICPRSITGAVDELGTWILVAYAGPLVLFLFIYLKRALLHKGETKGVVTLEALDEPLRRGQKYLLVYLVILLVIIGTIEALMVGIWDDLVEGDTPPMSIVYMITRAHNVTVQYWLFAGLVVLTMLSAEGLVYRIGFVRALVRRLDFALSGALAMRFLDGLSSLSKKVETALSGASGAADFFQACLWFVKNSPGALRTLRLGLTGLIAALFEANLSVSLIYASMATGTALFSLSVGGDGGLAKPQSDGAVLTAAEKAAEKLEDKTESPAKSFNLVLWATRLSSWQLFAEVLFSGTTLVGQVSIAFSLLTQLITRACAVRIRTEERATCDLIQRSWDMMLTGSKMIREPLRPISCLELQAAVVGLRQLGAALSKLDGSQFSPDDSRLDVVQRLVVSTFGNGKAAGGDQPPARAGNRVAQSNQG